MVGPFIFLGIVPKKTARDSLTVLSKIGWSIGGADRQARMLPTDPLRTLSEENIYFKKLT